MSSENSILDQAAPGHVKVWMGWGCVRSTLRLRPEPFATVRNRPREVAIAVPMVGSAKRGHFWRFHMSRSLVSRGRRGTSWHSDVLHNVSKVVCVAGAILLRRFQKMRSSFRGRRSTLDVSIFILRGRRSTSDVSCCVFSANRIVRAASSGDKVQIPWQAWHFVRGAENWRKPRTKHRFWSYEVRKLEEILHEMLILMLQHVSSRVSGFPVASQCLCGKLQNLSCFKVSKPVVTWLWVACVAVRDILMCLQTCRKSSCVARAIVLLRALHSTL